MACSGCAKRRAAAGQPRPTMLRVETESFEIIGPDGARTGATYPTVEEARAARGDGQVRRRVDYRDVPAAYSVRVDGEEIARYPKAGQAAQASQEQAGATVHMVPAE
jgi:hypothetical protein